jgi:histidinol phosphatase-like enzyme
MRSLFRNQVEVINHKPLNHGYIPQDGFRKYSNSVNEQLKKEGVWLGKKLWNENTNRRGYWPPNRLDLLVECSKVKHLIISVVSNPLE